MLATVFAQFGRLSFPTAIVTARSGEIFVAFHDGHPVVKLNRRGERLREYRLPEEIREVETMSITPDDRLCLLCSDPPAVFLIDAQTGRSALILLPPDVSTTALAVSAGGLIVVAATNMPCLVCIDASNNDRVSEVALDDDTDPSALKVDGAGTIYVADWSSCRIDRIRAASGTDVNFWTPRQGVPTQALALTAGTRQLIASGADGSVAQLDLETDLVRMTDEARPESLAAHVIEVAANGTAYLPSHRSGDITRVSTTGSISTTRIDGVLEGEHVFTDCTLTADGVLLAVSFTTGTILGLDVA